MKYFIDDYNEKVDDNNDYVEIPDPCKDITCVNRNKEWATLFPRKTLHLKSIIPTLNFTEELIKYKKS